MKEKETKIEKEARYKKITYWVIFWIIIALISIPLWYLTVPPIVTWFVWKKTKLDKKKKLIITGLAVLFLIVMCSIKYYTDRTPTIIITEPENNFSIQANDIIIKGIVTPKKSKVTINSNSIPVKDGSFIYDAKLIKENNRFVFIATNSGNENKTSIIINRILTEEEIAEKEAKRQASIEDRRKAEAEKETERQAAIEAKRKAREKKEAEELAEQRAWEQSKAGQICTAHPEWIKSECERIANNKIWIGMTIDMLKYRRGLPDSANPSDYGFGVSWQWCWWDHTPSCFYGGNNGIIDSFN